MMPKFQFLMVWIFLVLFEVGSQVFMKKLSVVTETVSFGVDWVIKAASSIDLWASFACDIASFLLWVVILQRSDLGKAFPQSSITFVGVVGTSWLFFDENPTAFEWLGCLLIVLGIVCLNSERSSPESEAYGSSWTSALRTLFSRWRADT